MIDAVSRLLQEGAACCRFHSIITGDRTQEEGEQAINNLELDMNQIPVSQRLNASQVSAVKSCRAPLSLIWGPPGKCDICVKLSSDEDSQGLGKRLLSSRSSEIFSLRLPPMVYYPKF